METLLEIKLPVIFLQEYLCYTKTQIYTPNQLCLFGKNLLEE